MTKRLPKRIFLESVVTLPFPFGADAAIAGKTYPVSLAGQDYKLVLASIAEGNRKPVMRPPTFRTVKKDINWRSYLGDPWAWGSVTEWTTSGLALAAKAFSIRHAMLRKTCSTEAELASASDNLFANLDEWLSVLADWVEILTMQNIFGHMKPDEDSRAVHVWGFTGSEYKQLRSPRTPMFTVVSTDNVSLKQWRAILRKANALEHPPLEHQLLRDAQRLLVVGDTRRAVLDAATAAELSAVRLLDSALSATPPPVKELALDRRRELGPKVIALTKLSAPIPADTMDGLVKLRNAAIHSGMQPSAGEAERAVAIAATMVAQAVPKADLLA